MEKNILIGMTGGIACYKTASLISKLKNAGYNVDVIMTKNAQEFITPLTIQTLCKNKVVTDMFENVSEVDVKHISLAEKANLVLIVPATANIIGKVASGIADDMLSTVIMATKSKVVFAPAMNNNMFENKIVQKNIETLKNYGYDFISPQVGHLACGTTAIGKLAESADIFDYVERFFKKEGNI